jgi:hypothetical protein
MSMLVAIPQQPQRFLGLKDLAQMFQLHPKSVRRLYTKLGVPPTIEAHACHRWSPEDVARLIDAWKTVSREERKTKPTP